MLGDLGKKSGNKMKQRFGRVDEDEVIVTRPTSQNLEETRANVVTDAMLKHQMKHMKHMPHGKDKLKKKEKAEAQELRAQEKEVTAQEIELSVGGLLKYAESHADYDTTRVSV